MNKKPDIGIETFVGYGLGALGTGLPWTLTSIFLLYFYTDIFGISPGAAGLLFLLTKIWDAVNDPVVGHWVDKTRTRRGRFRPFIALAAIIVPVSLYLTFTSVNFGDAGKLIYAYTTYIMLGIGLTLGGIPFHGIPKILTGSNRKRLWLVSVKQFGSLVGTLIMVKGAKGFVERLGGGQVGYSRMALICAAVAFCSYMLVIWIIRKHDRMEFYEEPLTVTHHNFLDSLKVLVSNRPLATLVIAQGTNLMALISSQAAPIYFFKYNLKKPDAFGTFMMIRTLTTIVMVVAVPFIASRLGKRRTFITGTLISLIFPVSLLTFRFTSLPIIYSLSVITDLGFFMASALSWTMVLDCADYAQHKTGRRSDGIIMSTFTFSNKMGIALGSAIAGGLLAWFGYVRPATPDAVVEQSESALFGILLMMTLLPIVSSVASLIAIHFYPLTDKQIDDIRNELNGDIRQ